MTSHYQILTLNRDSEKTQQEKPISILKATWTEIGTLILTSILIAILTLNARIVRPRYQIEPKPCFD